MENFPFNRSRDASSESGIRCLLPFLAHLSWAWCREGELVGGVGREGSDFSVLQERASPGMRKPKHSPCSIFSGTDSGEILPSSRKTSALRQGLEKGRLMRGHKPE